MNFDDLERDANARLDPATAEFIARGGGPGLSAEGNARAFARRWLVPRSLVDVSSVEVAVTVLGRPVAAPVGVAPLPRLQTVSAGAERDLAEAAAAAEVIFCAPTNASRSLEDLAIAGAPQWFQLYVHADDGITDDLVDRAARSGYDAVVVTVDRPVESLPAHQVQRRVHKEAIDAYPNLRPYGGDEVVTGRHHPGFAWADLERLCARSRVPVVVKGVLHPDDAARAAATGCAGVWVSNHGGRLLDRAIAPLEVTADVVAAVGDACEVYLDGGVRTASDVAIALALGARAVFLGRPLAHALAVGGTQLARRALSELKADIETTLGLLGVPHASMLGADHIRVVCSGDHAG